MRLEEIYKQKWLLSENLEIVNNDISGISIEEQELHINVDRTDNIIHVCCSDQRYLTKLKKSELFTINRILVSNNPQTNGFVLEVTGKMPIGGITIKNKAYNMTEQTKKALRLQLQELRKKKEGGLQ